MGEPVDGVDYVLSTIGRAFVEMMEGPEGSVHAEAFARGLAYFVVKADGLEVFYDDETVRALLEAEVRRDME